MEFHTRPDFLRSSDFFLLEENTLATKLEEENLSNRNPDSWKSWTTLKRPFTQLKEPVTLCSHFQSKGGILAKTCDYIIDLQTSNQRFAENAKEYERMQLDYEVVRLQVGFIWIAIWMYCINTKEKVFQDHGFPC